MKVTVKKGLIEHEPAEAIVLTHWEGVDTLSPELQAVDRRLHRHVRELFTTKEFTGKLQQLVVLHTLGALPPKRIVLVGLGKKQGFVVDRLRQCAGVASRRLREIGAASFSIGVPSLPDVSAAETAQALVEGICLGLYQYLEYRTEGRNEVKVVDRATLVDREGHRLRALEMGSRRGQVFAEATTLARDLGNAPSNAVTPTRLAEIAKETAEAGGFACTVMDRPQMERLGLGAVLGVAKGSQEPPKFIILEYAGSPTMKRPIALVGKSITFDSGGISLKPAEKMEQMKGDMAGGAAVLGVLRAAATLKLPVNVVGLLPATENLPSGSAIKPGDVLRSFSGKTIEVINTDAEGRLALADALAYVIREYRPVSVVDIATLTGAVVVALGEHAIGLMGNHSRLLARLKQAGETTGERTWELPLWQDYFEQIKSDVADVKNVGGRPAGAITAGAFLSKFVDNTPWAHLDIAGTSWADSERAYTTKGATGAGTRLLLEFLCTATNERVR